MVFCWKSIGNLVTKLTRCSMLEYIYSTKITKEAPFGVLGTITNPKNDFMVKTIVEVGIGFLLEINR